jgi:CHAT domain-containing protein
VRMHACTLRLFGSGKEIHVLDTCRPRGKLISVLGYDLDCMHRGDEMQTKSVLHSGRMRPFSSKLFHNFPRAFSGGLVGASLLISAWQAAALTIDQAREKCRETVGMPIFRACMRGGGGNFEACRAKAHPEVHACVQAAMNAANGRPNIAVPTPTEAAPAAAETAPLTARPSFVPPPRAIADITAILDAEKPDAERIDQWKAAADVNPPGDSSPAILARFYYDRGNARAQLGRLSEAIADANAAVEAARRSGDVHMLGRHEQFLGLQYFFAGQYKQAMTVFLRQINEVMPGSRGYQFNSNRNISQILIRMGDIAQAETFLRRNTALIAEARTSGLPGWRTYYPILGQSWESNVEAQRALIFEARGQFRDAEASYRLAELRHRASIKTSLSQPDPPPETEVLHWADALAVYQARMKARQGRLAEAEADARRALLARLKDQGKYSPRTPFYIAALAEILVGEGRYEDAENLIRAAIEITRRVGIADDTHNMARLLSNLGSVLNLQRKPREAAAVYAELDRAIANWEPLRRQTLELNGSYIYSLYASGRLDAGIALAQALVKREVARVGENHFLTAAARGTLAIGYMRAGRDEEAAREFNAAIPIMVAAARENADDDDTTGVAARIDQLQDIIEAYISLRASHKDGLGADPASETFGLVEAIRGRSVQHAILASSARMVARDPALAELFRKVQDLSMQVSAQLGLLNNVLSLPQDERDESVVRGLRNEIERLRGEHSKAEQEISRNFPSYADLVEPKSPSVEDVRSSLQPGEVLTSFYFGRNQSFVWAIPKDGPIGFSVIPASLGEIEAKVNAVRKTLEPLAGFIPPFDLADAYELYALLLRPIEPILKPERNLIVVTNGALGLLPLSLLPTAPSVVSANTGPQFAGYRDVPWLARTHSVTSVPSASALLTLRRIPPGSSQRESFIGFGDPLFNEEQAAEAAKEENQRPERVAAASATGTEVRGVTIVGRVQFNTRGLDRADIGSLPRLPDTAMELRAIAQALGADPSKSLYLEKDATEENVKKIDLSRFRVVAFSTHGLVAGDLDGLTQPALALTAPSVADPDDDGLLTMEEILALKLDADWVVLSACNTAAGAAAGAEANSGLGRAFFYAGARTLLVTNWSVHSEAARDLVSELFERQHRDPTLSRSEALRQAMIALLDGGGYRVAGRTVFTYAHPWFWAPYSIIGDGR